MKKIFATLLVGLMAVSVTACSNNNNAPAASVQPASTVESSVTSDVSAEESNADEKSSTNEESTEDSSESSVSATGIGEKLQKGFVDIVHSDKFHYDIAMSLIIGENESEMEIEMAKDGDNIYVMVDFSGVSYAVIKNSEGAYAVSPAEKQAVIATEEEFEQFTSQIDTSEMFDVTGFELLDSGNKEYNGKSYDYETYTTGDDESDVTFYFDNDILVYMVSTVDGEDQVAEFKTLTTDVDASLFEIPSDYTITEASAPEISVAEGVSLTVDE